MTSHYPTYKQSIGLLFIWFLCIMLSALIIILPFFSTDDGIGLSLAYTLSFLLTIAAAFHIRGNWSLPTSRFSPFIILASTIVIFSSQIILDPLQDLIPESDALIEMTQGMRTQPIAYFLMIAISAPILEEILFRGVILDGFLKNYKPTHAILVSAFLFALIHGNLAQGLGAFTIGALFGWLYWKTKSIIPSIILHAINNGIAFFATISMSEDDLFKTTRELINNDLTYVSLYIASIILVGAGVWYLHKKYSTITPVDEPIVIIESGDELKV